MISFLHFEIFFSCFFFCSKCLLIFFVSFFVYFLFVCLSLFISFIFITNNFDDAIKSNSNQMIKLLIVDFFRWKKILAKFSDSVIVKEFEKYNSRCWQRHLNIENVNKQFFFVKTQQMSRCLFFLLYTLIIRKWLLGAKKKKFQHSDWDCHLDYYFWLFIEIESKWSPDIIPDNFLFLFKLNKYYRLLCYMHNIILMIKWLFVCYF